MSSENPTRRKILDTAWKLLEAGGSPTRMSDFARAAGISRQALYLHFPSRAELLVAVTRHVDAVKDVDARLAESRAAEDGETRLAAFVSAWGNYIPEIRGVSRALMAMQESDAEARAAWQGRMEAVRQGCAAAVAALARDGQLAGGLSEERATDLLWALLSVESWVRLCETCGWSQQEYITEMQRAARRILLG
ncbi:transcriptional regulator, TetR family [Pseudooceanicola antarcticus]|uniref:TetR/AcrR family transcriptional regulator n=1 Tax=Pseudooceanicola antarcticus TaxID=1247613 RepID=A0A285J3Y0_9RHOB|nr:TetR/AcrR family transcriptional regulator [Pseudooceanicola antarcticus]PJE29668.1 TetR/AcrR family transcriptional regulator [Pseudooceanicola antarcticus]SNY54912.1 transcriptional regulator, TetR family [Pseudooceanicola antarcticus]